MKMISPAADREKQLLGKRRSFSEYRRFIRSHYDGLPGALTAFSGFLTGHESLASRLIGPGRFDVRGCPKILDAGCGNGRYTRLLVRHSDPDAVVVGFDYSQQMLYRARRRLRRWDVPLAAADLTRLPFADGCFDAAVCGWVIEHLPDARFGLRELARVIRPGGKLLLLATDETLSGSICSRMWHCRTYSREELRGIGVECGFEWTRELWFSPMHKLLRLGGIIVELRRT